MGNAALAAVAKRGSEPLGAAPRDFFALEATDIAGRKLPFAELRGRHRAFIVTNVACKCGLTSDTYRQLVELHERYAAQGLAVLAFPCNQFGGQEPQPEAEIERYLKETFAVRFHLFSKVDVNGPNAHSVFRFLRAHSELAEPGADGEARVIPWNFAKFLLDAEGRVVGYFPPKVNPSEMEGEVRRLLNL